MLSSLPARSGASPGFRTRRVRALPWFSRTSLEIHQLQLDKALGEALPVSPDVLEKLFEQDNVALGRALYRSLVPEELQQEIEDRAASPRNGLRLRLRFDQATGLATLPWELMHGGENLGFLGQREDTALGRYIARGTLQRQWVSKELKVLVVLALPKDVERLDLVAEKERLEQTLGDIERVEVAYLLGVNAAALLGQEALAQKLQPQISDRLREKDGWDVVHFVGHAGLDRLPEPGTQAEVVLWSEDENGDYEALDADRLGTMLKGLPSQSTPKLIVLNACETAHIESKLVKAILDSGVGAVVGMQWPVADVTGLAFTQGFYNTLEAHGQVDRAVSVARNEMAQIEPERRDWAAPVLVMQIDDGFIFKRA
jgi:CHAT domain-containing protein